MGKHYCDYCDVFLTHDSVSVRKAHNSGRNHQSNVRDYYAGLDMSELNTIQENVFKKYDERGIPRPVDFGGFKGGDIRDSGHGGGFRGGFRGGSRGSFRGRGGFEGGGRGGYGGSSYGDSRDEGRGGYAGGFGSGPMNARPPFAARPPPNFSEPPPVSSYNNQGPPQPLGMFSRPPPGFNPNVPPPSMNVPPPGFGGSGPPLQQQPAGYNQYSQPPPGSGGYGGPPRPLGMHR